MYINLSENSSKHCEFMLRFNVLDNKRVPCHRRIETDRLGGNKVLGFGAFSSDVFL